MPYDAQGNWITERSDGSREEFISDSDRVLASIPIIGGLGGSQGRIDAANNARESNRNRQYWDTMPTYSAEDLTADYQYDPSDEAAQRQALEQMQRWGSGGLTDADRGAMAATRRQDERGARGQRDALMQQAQARGMGGSGLDYATQMSADQAGQAQSSDAEAQMMQGAQQRALAAVQAQGQLGGQMRGQMQHEQEMLAEAPVQGRIEAQTEREHRAAGATNQYSTDSGNRNSAAARAQRDRESATAGLGSIIASLVG